MNSISDIVTASYKTSKEADRLSKDLKRAFGSESNYEIARLAIGRSLSILEAPAAAPDGNGLALKGMQLFGNEDDGNYLWIALLGEQLRIDGQPSFSLENFQKLVRDHWHRGVFLLKKDWIESDEKFFNLIELLSRKAALPETNNKKEILINSKDQDNFLKLELKIIEETEKLFKVFSKVGIKAEIKDHLIGPRITRYTLYLPKSSHFNLLEKKLDEISFILGNLNNKLCINPSNESQTCFLDIPRNKESWLNVDIQHFSSSLKEFINFTLPVSPGVDVTGKPMLFDLLDAPHLLIGGATGTGKSVCMNSILLSLYLASKQTSLKLALIDPKQVEFSIWKKCNILYREVADSHDEIHYLLDDLINEMEDRFQWLKTIEAKNLYDAINRGYKKDFIIVAVDELADLVKNDKSFETKFIQLAQKSRASGIHLILATQRPDANTFDGLLRSNCPARIALKVQKLSESKIILDESGAENLLGTGDMIIKTSNLESIRSHGYFISNDDIESRLN